LLGVAELKFDEFDHGFDGDVKLMRGGFLKIVMRSTPSDPLRTASNPEGTVATNELASKTESLLETSEHMSPTARFAEEHASQAGDQLASAASQGDSQPTPAEEMPTADAAIGNVQKSQAESELASAEEALSTEAVDTNYYGSRAENQLASTEKVRSAETCVRSMSESRVAMPSAQAVADVATSSPQAQVAGDSQEQCSGLEPNRPVKAADLKNLCTKDMRWHQWSTMGDRLEGKTPWSKLSQDRATKEEPKTASIPLSVEWFRKHWSDVRKSSCPDEGSRPSSAQGRNQRLGDLVSPQAFQAKMSELHKEQSGEDLQLISSGEVKPPLMQVLDISLPPPPDFAPPVRQEDQGLGAQQQAIAAALSAHATTVDRGLGAEQRTIAAVPSVADTERGVDSQPQNVAAALGAHAAAIGAQQKAAAAVKSDTIGR